MNGTKTKKIISLQLEEGAARQLAALCKRAFLERVQPFAASREEAESMLAALDELAKALSDSGFAPR
jgi:hypothetical protein